MLSTRFFWLARGQLANHSTKQLNYRISKRCISAQSFRSLGQFRTPIFTGFVGVAGFIGVSSFALSSSVADAQTEEPNLSPGQFIPNLPEFRNEDVKKHNTIETGIWVTIGRGVYDITTFIQQHPGGQNKIMLAAGGALEPYWAIYANHKTEETFKLLEEFRIGNLAEVDVVEADPDSNDPYYQDPPRLPILKVNSSKPFNAETPPSLLVDSYTTPNQIHFVRNHFPVPHIDEHEYRLEVIAGPNQQPLHLSLEDIKTKFPKHRVIATIQCAGNRREEMNTIKKVKGLSWELGAIGTSEWSGARLRDVLEYAGFDPSTVESTIHHLQAEGYDGGIDGSVYGASIPIRKAWEESGDVLLAYEMNGEPIPLDHGFPVRLIVPGVVGARNVKWLRRVIASTEESSALWQQRDYKGFCPSVDWDNVDFSKSPAIQELPVQSAICEPTDGTTVTLEQLESIEMKGYAWSGGGRQIVRVDVSVDGGKNWYPAELNHDSEELSKVTTQKWAWRTWSAWVMLPPELAKEVREKGETKLEMICKAVDSSYNTQPDTVAPIWNLRGVLNNSWHRVKIIVKP